MLAAVESTLPRPISAVLARCAALDDELEIHHAVSGPGWIDAMVLLGPGPALRTRLDDLHRRWGTPDRRVDATFAMGAYAWFLGIAAIGPYLVGDVVPDVAPDNVAVRLDADGSLDAVALQRLDVVGSGAVALHGALHDHLALVVDRLRDECRIGRRALWAVAADSLAAVFLYAGQRLGDEPRALEAVAEVLGDRSSQLHWRGAFVEVAHGGRGATFQCRESCCLSYRLADGERCDSCPLRDADDRSARFASALVASRLD